MKNSTFLFIAFLLCIIRLDAQSGTTLPEQLDALLAIYPSEVLVGKDNLQQEITYEKASPYRISISQTEEGEETAMVEVNLGLITKVRDYSHKKNGITVILSSGTTATIKAFENDEVDGYLKETSILAEDVNNGREMEELLKQILPLAKEAWENATALPDGPAALQQFTSERVVNSTFGDEEYVQSLEFLSGVGNAQIITAGSANKDEETTYILSLADLDPKKIDISAKGNEIEVSLSTKKRSKYIEVQEEEDKSFDSSMELIFDGFDDAQVFAYALKSLIEEAEKAEKAAIPSYTDTDAALKQLSSLLEAAQIDNIDQVLAPQCRTTHEVQDGEDEFSYQFDFADLDVKDLSLAPKGDIVFLPLSTKSNEKFIGVKEGDEVKNYDNEVEFQFNSIAQAKMATYAVEHLIKNCPTEIATPSVEMVMLLLKAAEREDGEVTQEGSVGGENDCTMELNQTENGKNTEEVIYEFNLYDLDPKSGKVIVKGTEVNVTFTTKGKEDIIQVLENNEEQTYTNTIVFFANDLASAKTILKGIQEAIAACTE